MNVKCMHSKKKRYFRAPFFVLQVVKIEDSIQYLEGPQDGPQTDPKIPVMVLPGTIWSFQVLNRVLYL